MVSKANWSPIGKTADQRFENCRFWEVRARRGKELSGRRSTHRRFWVKLIIVLSLEQSSLGLAFVGAFVSPPQEWSCHFFSFASLTTFQFSQKLKESFFPLSSFPSSFWSVKYVKGIIISRTILELPWGRSCCFCVWCFENDASTHPQAKTHSFDLKQDSFFFLSFSTHHLLSVGLARNDEFKLGSTQS